MYYRHFYGSSSAGWLDVVRHPSPFTRNPPPHSPERFFPVPHSLHCVSAGCMLFGLYNSCRSREAEAPTSAMNESAPKSFYSWDREWSWGWWWRIPLKILYPNVSVFGFSASFKFKGMRTEDRQPIWNESETSIRFYIPVDGWTGVSLLYSGWDCGPLVCRIIYLHFTSKETDRQIADCLTRRRSS